MTAAIACLNRNAHDSNSDLEQVYSTTMEQLNEVLAKSLLFLVCSCKLRDVASFFVLRLSSVSNRSTFACLLSGLLAACSKV
jgi:hypothetical protein